ncbi:Uncharacterized protein DIS24_g4536 [Lasiodiplodia hormozganensis]|uniref:Neuroguidin n=1 Tax=Lasiodiplodia hormozganensis TaxID=869390 RepID=A0AA39YUI1_9PEZI|nr:Uncharacterized protein DIS24_g4536 [Lasiodiplodia hormozganensis]
MAAAKLDTSLPTLLSNLTASLTSAAEPVPSPAADDDASDSLQPKDGISLLDVKNELLLSYLQNLVFLILLKLRNNEKTGNKKQQDGGESTEDVVKKLCELRLYLEKGARPLEGKLKYQIDKVVRAADDAARAEEALKKAGTSAGKKNKKKAEKADSDDESEDDDEDASGSDEDEDDEDASDIDELAYRPNPLAFARGSAAAADTDKKSKKKDEPSDGIYRPPRITATAMPEDLPRYGGREDRDRGPRRAAAIDDFVDEHLSTAPIAQPSIGSNVVDGGRRVKSARERADEEERRAYEETNFVRLPKVGKKERAKNAGRNRNAFGGEEWRELGAGVDRIDRLTRRGERTSTKSALEKSRKRAVDDGPRASGAEAGAMFAKRRKVAQRRR